jgi:hypothetical protein
MILTLLLVAQMSCSEHHSHGVDQRGDAAMGFSHQATKHAFRPMRDGGAIEVRALDGNDAKSIEAIRVHLQEITKSFAAGDFAKPEYIHDQLPDGAAEMRDLRNVIRYRYEELDRGGRVRLSTADKRAVRAIHRFLRFQSAEHQTGD